MTTRYFKSELVRLAAEMVRGEGMPSHFREDWDWPKTMPKSAWLQVWDTSREAHEKCRQWGIALKELADKVKETP